MTGIPTSTRTRGGTLPAADLTSSGVARPRGPEPASAEARGVASAHVLGIRVDATSYADASRRILGWARSRESRYVCVASVNNVMVARQDPTFLGIMNGADLVTPDGMPLVWALRWLGIPTATRVRGTDLMIALLGKAAEAGVPVGLYGGDPRIMQALVDRLGRAWPGLDVAYAHSPPFRPLTPDEDERTVREIVASGARIVFVGLGCPKQEEWMAGHRGQVPAVTIGVGAAFDFLSGEKMQAPGAMQRAGLEWLFRLLTEPKRLWRRYLRQNPAFLGLLALQVAGSRMKPGSSHRPRSPK
jgi:N-acetylglucosaminyldiphosphoundecaprenol N-acetyl-beta-D-mannosaminyltransferase